MLKTNLLDKQKVHIILTNVICAFILFQPIFDLLSFLHIREYISVGISTYAKPLIIGLINLVLIFTYKKQLLQCGITYGCYLALMIVHSLLLKGMLIENSLILHEIRFMINILYFLICYHDLRILHEEATDKKQFATQLKKVLIATFIFYIFLYLLSVFTGTASLTYEYSDATKVGFKGWMDSGQIFGHALCICLPFISTAILNNKISSPLLRYLCKFGVVLPLTILCMIGTKVSYYIAVLVIAIQVILELFFAIRKKGNGHYINAAICLVCAVTCVLIYPLTPVKHNTDINNYVMSIQPDEDKLEELLETEKDKHDLTDNDSDSNDHSNTEKPIMTEADKNAEWTGKALDLLQQKYANGTLHPADMRNRQLFFNMEKFKLADLKYKLFGIGYVFNGDMAIERDVLCILFSFGIIGFLVVLLRPILLWIKSAFVLLKRLFKADIETFALFEGFSMFFFISWYAGATFIYTNFSIFLSIIICLLTYNINKTKTAN